MRIVPSIYRSIALVADSNSLMQECGKVYFFALGNDFTKYQCFPLISDAITFAIIKVYLLSMCAMFSHLAGDFFRIPRLPPYIAKIYYFQKRLSISTGNKKLLVIGSVFLHCTLRAVKYDMWFLIPHIFSLHCLLHKDRRVLYFVLWPLCDQIKIVAIRGEMSSQAESYAKD